MLLTNSGRCLELQCFAFADETAQNAPTATCFIANAQATPSRRPSSGHKVRVMSVMVNGTDQSRSSPFAPKNTDGSGIFWRLAFSAIAFAH